MYENDKKVKRIRWWWINHIYDIIIFMISVTLPSENALPLLLCEWVARKECEDWMDGLSLLQRELSVEDWHRWCQWMVIAEFRLPPVPSFHSRQSDGLTETSPPSASCYWLLSLLQLVHRLHRLPIRLQSSSWPWFQLAMMKTKFRADAIFSRHFTIMVPLPPI